MLVAADDSKLEAQVPEAEKAHAKRLLKRIESADKVLKERAKGWDKARQYADGDVADKADDDSGLVRVNLIGSVTDTILPAIYAKAPEIAVTMDDRITSADYQIYSKFTETLQDALNTYLVKEAKLKARGKSTVRTSLISTIGWTKIVYQKDVREDPVIKGRINDTQDNIEAIKALIAETSKEGGECAEHEAKLFELNQQSESLQKQIEVVVSEGLVVDTVAGEDIIILDASCRDVDDFDQAACIVHRIRMTVEAFKAQFKMSPPAGAKKYVGTTGDAEVSTGEVDEDDKLVVVYEAWSHKDVTVYTMVEGCHRYIREPYQPTVLGQRWYPFFPLQLRRVAGIKYPRSLVEQLIELQDEYNTRRTNAAEHRKKNIPVRLLNKSSGITDAEVTAITNRSIQTDVIGVTVDTGQPLQNQLGNLPDIPYNPQMYDTTDIMRDIEMVGNTQDASRGAINKAKTATEAEIMSAGMQSRTSESIDVVEDWLTDQAIYSAQLLLQHMTPEQIKERFGADAVWPTLTKRQMFSMVNVTIRAGSTSRPNKMRERDQWIQILPIIQTALEKLMMFKQQGMTDMADTIVALLDETLKRFDERLDAKALLGIKDQREGGDEEQGEGQPGEIPPEVQAQIKQMQEQTQAAMAEVDKQRAELDAQAHQLEIDRINQTADNKVASIEAKAAQEKTKALADQAAFAAKEQVAKMMQGHMDAVRQLVDAAEQQEPDEGQETDNHAQLLEGIAAMNQQLQEQIAMVMQGLAQTNAMLAAPKQVTTPSGQTYTMQTMPGVSNG